MLFSSRVSRPLNLVLTWFVELLKGFLKNPFETVTGRPGHAHDRNFVVTVLEEQQSLGSSRGHLDQMREWGRAGGREQKWLRGMRTGGEIEWKVRRQENRAESFSIPLNSHP